MRQIKTMDHDHYQGFDIAIVISKFNADMTDELQRGALQRLAERGFHEDLITLVEVPGAIEIPLVLQRLAQTKKYTVMIALGAVIRGETSHYDYVCQQVSHGTQAISLKYDVPIIFKVLTTENEAQAWDRLGGVHGHHGIQAVDAAIAMHSILQQL